MIVLFFVKESKCFGHNCLNYGDPEKLGLFQAEIFFLALISNFLFESVSLAIICPLTFFDFRPLSVCKVMLFGHILTFLNFLVHPRLSGSFQAVRQEIPRPETFANSFLTTF